MTDNLPDDMAHFMLAFNVTDPELDDVPFAHEAELDAAIAAAASAMAVR